MDSKLTGLASPLAPPPLAGVTFFAHNPTDVQVFAQASLVGAEGEGRLVAGVSLDHHPRVSPVNQVIPPAADSPPRKVIRLETEPHGYWQGGEQSQDDVKRFWKVFRTSPPLHTYDGVVAPALQAEGSLPPLLAMRRFFLSATPLIRVIISTPFRRWVYCKMEALLTHHSL